MDNRSRTECALSARPTTQGQGFRVLHAWNFGFGGGSFFRFSRLSTSGPQFFRRQIWILSIQKSCSWDCKAPFRSSKKKQLIYLGLPRFGNHGLQTLGVLGVLRTSHIVSHQMMCFSVFHRFMCPPSFKCQMSSFLPPFCHDTCSDSIAKHVRACFCRVVAQVSRDMLQNGVLHRCACVKISTKGVILATFWGAANLPEKYRAIWGIAAIVSQYRAIWGQF